MWYLLNLSGHNYFNYYSPGVCALRKTDSIVGRVPNGAHLDTVYVSLLQISISGWFLSKRGWGELWSRQLSGKTEENLLKIDFDQQFLKGLIFRPALGRAIPTGFWVQACPRAGHLHILMAVKTQSAPVHTSKLYLSYFRWLFASGIWFLGTS